MKALNTSIMFLRAIESIDILVNRNSQQWISQVELSKVRKKVDEELI